MYMLSMLGATYVYILCMHAAYNPHQPQHKTALAPFRNRYAAACSTFPVHIRAHADKHAKPTGTDRDDAIEARALVGQTPENVSQ